MSNKKSHLADFKTTELAENIVILSQNKSISFKPINFPSNLLNSVLVGDKIEITRTRAITITISQVFLKTTSSILARGQKSNILENMSPPTVHCRGNVFAFPHCIITWSGFEKKNQM